MAKAAPDLAFHLAPQLLNVAAQIFALSPGLISGIPADLQQVGNGALKLRHGITELLKRNGARV